MKWWINSVGLLLAAVTATTVQAQSGTRDYYNLNQPQGEVVSDSPITTPSTLHGEPGTSAEYPTSTYFDDASSWNTTYSGTTGYEYAGGYGYAFGKGCCRQPHPKAFGLWRGFCHRGCGCKAPRPVSCGCAPKPACGCAPKPACGCAAPTPCRSCGPKWKLPKLHLKSLFTCPCGTCSTCKPRCLSSCGPKPCNTCAPEPHLGCGWKRPHFNFFGWGKSKKSCGCGYNAGYGYGYGMPGYGTPGYGTPGYSGPGAAMPGFEHDGVITESPVEGQPRVLSEGDMYQEATPIEVQPQPPTPIEEIGPPIDPPPNDRSAWRLFPKKFRMFPASWSKRERPTEPTPAAAIPARDESSVLSNNGYEYFDTYVNGN